MYKGVYFIFATLPYFNGGIPVPRVTNCMNAHTRDDTCVASASFDLPRSILLLSSQVCTYRGIYGRDLWRTHRLGTRDATELARRGVHMLSLSFSSSSFISSILPSPSRAPFISILHATALPFSQNHSHVRQSAPTKVAGHFSERPIP